MNIQGDNCWIVASLGCVIADLPQGNDLIGVKRHDVIKGYRICLVAKENAMDENLNITIISHLGLQGKTLISFWQKSKLFENNFDGFRRLAKVSTIGKSFDDRQKF